MRSTIAGRIGSLPRRYFRTVAIATKAAAQIW
jgi:hypothetical protein